MCWHEYRNKQTLLLWVPWGLEDQVAQVDQEGLEDLYRGFFVALAKQKKYLQ